MKYRKGEVWRIRHARKGGFLVKLNQDINPKQEWFDSVIISGKANYMSRMNRELQDEIGKGVGGDVLTSRTSFVEFLERLPQLEKGAKR